MTRSHTIPGRSLALARFTLASNLGHWLTRGGLLVGAAVMALGPLLSLRRGSGWSFDADVGFMGFVIMALFAARSGYRDQRDLELATFIRQNLASRLEYALGLILALIATWACICIAAFVTVLLLAAADPATAAWHAASWHTAAWGLRLLVLLGFVPLVEAIASLRLPLVLPILAYWGLVITLTVLLPEDRAIAMFIPVERGNVEALARLGLQGAVSLTATSALFVAGSVAVPDLRLRLQRIVPIRH